MDFQTQTRAVQDPFLRGKVPITCLGCGATFNAHRLSSPWFATRHEQESAVHLRWARGLSQMEAPAGTQLCAGIRVMDPFSGLRDLQASVATHMQKTDKCQLWDQFSRRFTSLRLTRGKPNCKRNSARATPISFKQDVAPARAVRCAARSKI